MVFPKFRHKHLHDAMFSPQDYLYYLKKIGRYPKFEPPEAAILCYDMDFVKHKFSKKKTTKFRIFHSDIHLLKETKNKVAVVSNFGCGASTVAIILEELIAFGVKKFISIGTAGGLQKNQHIGDIIVCDKAIRDEGTSHHYLKHSKYSYASKELTQKIISALEKRKQKYLLGPSWTIDACYRETVAEAKHYQKEGVLAVDMEAAALFAIAKYRGAEIAAVFTVSDSLAELEWKPEFHHKKADIALKILFKAALDALLEG